MMDAVQFPPGPPPMTNLIDVARIIWQVARDPLGTFTRWWRDHGDFFVVRGKVLNYVVVSPDIIHEVVVAQAHKFHKDSDYTDEKYGLARFLGHGLLTSDGEFWKRQRRLAAPAFHARRIAAYSDTMVSYTERMLDGWHDGARLDIAREMTRLTMLIVAKTLFDADVSGDVERVGRAMEAVQQYGGSSMQLNLPILLLPLERRATRARRDLDEIIYRIINRRRAAGSDDRGDLLSMLLLAQDEDGTRMTDEQARDETVTLFLAGHETTANALNWTWLLLARHPEVEAKLHAELDSVLGGRAPTLADLDRLPYTDMVVKETLRLYPPAWGFGRMAIEAVELGGYTVPAGSSVGILSYLTHRHPAYWDEPERFLPERFSPDNESRLHKYAYIPFGGGARICIGNSFAMMEARLILATVASRFRLRLAPGQQVRALPLITLNPKDGLPMTLEARQPQAVIPSASQAVMG